MLSLTSTLKGPERVSVEQEFSGSLQGDPLVLWSGGVSQPRSPSNEQSPFAHPPANV